MKNPNGTKQYQPQLKSTHFYTGYTKMDLQHGEENYVTTIQNQKEYERTKSTPRDEKAQEKLFSKTDFFLLDHFFRISIEIHPH